MEITVSNISDDARLSNPSKPLAVITASIGEEIKAMRKVRGLSQKELSLKTGITTAEICRIEKNPVLRPSRKSLKALSPFLGKSYTSLLIQAGYSGTIPIEEEFFLPNGNAISPRQIGEALYTIDTELLSLLQDLPSFATNDNLDFLKLTLLAMKWESYQDSKKNISAEWLGVTVIINSFQQLKKFFIAFLSPLKALLA